MDNTTKDQIRETIKAKEQEVVAFSKAAQDEVNKRQQAIQQSQLELQALVRNFQKEIDRREGAVEQLKALIGETTPTEQADVPETPTPETVAPTGKPEERTAPSAEEVQKAVAKRRARKVS
jgi:hypothetical protein